MKNVVNNYNQHNVIGFALNAHHLKVVHEADAEGNSFPSELPAIMITINTVRKRTTAAVELSSSYQGEKP